MKDDFLNVPKIAAWKQSLINNGCTINTINPLSIYFRPDGELLFALLKADVTAPDGNTIPPIIFIRGHASVIVPVLKNRDTGEIRYLMVIQRRIASGALTLEFPAGILDRNIHKPAQTALRELEEETGLKLPLDSLIPLNSTPLYCSPGASDEGVYYFGCFCELDDSSYSSFEGRLTGSVSENEHIRVTLKTREEAEKECTSMPVLLGIFLFEEYYEKQKSPGATP